MSLSVLSILIYNETFTFTFTFISIYIYIYTFNCSFLLLFIIFFSHTFLFILVFFILCLCLSDLLICRLLLSFQYFYFHFSFLLLLSLDLLPLLYLHFDMHMLTKIMSLVASFQNIPKSTLEYILRTLFKVINKNQTVTDFLYLNCFLYFFYFSITFRNYKQCGQSKGFIVHDMTRSQIITTSGDRYSGDRYSSMIEEEQIQEIFVVVVDFVALFSFLNIFILFFYFFAPSPINKNLLPYIKSQDFLG